MDVKNEVPSTADYSSLGFYIGQRFDGIPLFKGIKPDLEGFKALSAGLATGRVSMFHVAPSTPKEIVVEKGLERVVYTESERLEVHRELNTIEEPDIICIGCPHSSEKEINEVFKTDPKKEIWLYTSRNMKNRLNLGSKKRNIKVIADTCMVVQPLEEMGITSLGTDSTKCAYYTKHLSGLDVRFESFESLLKKT